VFKLLEDGLSIVFCFGQAFQQQLQADPGAVFPPAAFSTATISGVMLSSSTSSAWKTLHHSARSMIYVLDVS
jgi:hypothetical protein